jgi:toxin ParE1/3/4
MREYRLSPQAEKEIEAILEWTHEKFGEEARVRYEALLERAIRDVAEAPELAGSRARPEIAGAARTYHLRHSRDRVKKSVGRVKQPRHFLLYRICTDGKVEFGRVLHDGMDLERHLPDAYRSGHTDAGDPV